jgi:3-deoxy-D-arabino-heptulosonate 7-phosphate (DAHP) synthase
VTILLSPVLSPQYVCGLLPWAAIVAVERESDDVRILAFGASVFAALAFAVYWGLRIQPALAAASAGKIVCLSGLAVIGFTHARSDRYRDA